MLETLDLDLKLDKDAYHAAMDSLGLELSILQRAAYESGLGALFVFEGLDGAGKGDAIARLVEDMDPRGFKVHTTRAATEDEALRPFLWRFWRRIPGRGAIAILDRSWYTVLIESRLSGELDTAGWDRAIEAVKDFERQLVDDGTLLVKFWLHISKKEQKRRVKAWSKDPYQEWRAREPVTTRHSYKQVIGAAEEILARTYAAGAPWVLVEAEDDRHRRVKILTEASEALRRALLARNVPIPQPDADPPEERAFEPHPDPLEEPPVVPRDSPLAGLELSQTLEPEAYSTKLHAAQSRLRELEFAAYAKRRAAVVVFEGSDAGGKGGAIKRLTEKLDPRGYEVVPIAAPRGQAAAHHYLWRFWREIPKAGHLTVFDRSWYGRVLVERVEGFASEPDWRRAYQEINEFERTLAEAGIVVIKFWLQVSPDEQLRRFRAREATPRKRFKITDEDWRNRAKLPQYLEAVSDMIRLTSTPYAPWTLVEANDKRFARVKVLETTARALEAGLGVE
jgi:polyphosphate:AMP phosphotransferase